MFLPIIYLIAYKPSSEQDKRSPQLSYDSKTKLVAQFLGRIVFLGKILGSIIILFFFFNICGKCFHTPLRQTLWPHLYWTVINPCCAALIPAILILKEGGSHSQNTLTALSLSWLNSIPKSSVRAFPEKL